MNRIVNNNFCNFCGVSISGRKKYCSNKGPGNCKDAYHNKYNPRGIGLLKENHPNALGDDDPSWDAHKETF